MTPSVIIKRHIFFECGGFDKTYKYADTKNEEASSEEQSEEQSEEDFKNVVTEANFTNKPYTKEERDIQNYKKQQLLF